MDKASIENIITDFLARSPENSLKLPTPEKAWEDVLVGYSSGADPIYMDYKTHVGEFHYTPEEIFNLTFPDSPAKAEDLTVISYVLVQREATKIDNRKETFYPSERWVMARFPGEKFNELLRQHLTDELIRAGFPAVAPILSPHWKMEMSEKYVYASRWSERHAAYASGLGTFGVCDGLITEKGKAHRVGSVVARVQISPTPRPYMDHHAYCLYYATGKCLVCAKRCPVDAISEKGHDKKACRKHAAGTCGEYVKQKWGFDGYGCGLCQTAVPCESGIPKGIRR
ncbi:MAG: epoxyqueuosine reductase [Proteobacteria bacterium]|nr:epoxyqueuosine reductase [Pseudomonadota bacterium]MBU4471041.1 epoxyqueuosine reductase [Pseudomonadota bacterium]MCG2753641.1 epoxyqueuosine reductase [Desulfobacteraceae bacterium]